MGNLGVSNKGRSSVMKGKLIDFEKWLKKKYKKTSNKDEEEKMHLCDKCRKQKRWRKENENNKRQVSKGSDISME